MSDQCVNTEDQTAEENSRNNLDGGSTIRSNRMQFIKRLVTFARDSGLTLELIYYPPYHSKYNPIERRWAALEQFWNGAILDSVETTLGWASRIIWKGFEPIVYHLTGIYEKSINIDPQTLAEFRVDWHPSEDLSKWAITIQLS